MCGIAGLFTSAPEGRENSSRPLTLIEAMNSAQRHRGPDDQGHDTVALGASALFLGHTRLSIQDLSPAGHQPMLHPQTRSRLIFNGEIYNVTALRDELVGLGHHFAGHSDTEVLLHGLDRFGAGYLKKLCGMFALAFFDAKTRTLLLARDPLGIKPLYVACSRGQLLFASEVRALAGSGLISRELDLSGVAGLLAFGAVQQPATLFRDIASFPPGCFQVFDEQVNSAGPQRYWHFSSPDASITPQDAREQVRRLLDQSVREHLISDVPVGVFLSSGLDSTIIAALAARHTPYLRSFTVGFSDQPDLSELDLARETAGLFGLQHTEIEIQGRDAEAAALQWLESLDQPSVDGFNIYLISHAVRTQGITVALSGQGGDELFGGYPSFVDVPRFHQAMRWIRWLPAGLRRALCSVATVGQSEAVKHKLRDILSTDASVAQLYLQRRRAMSDAQLESLGFEPEALRTPGGCMPGQVFQDLRFDSRDIVHAVSVLESIVYQGNMLLRDSDTNGMAHGLEIRVPMLDRRVIDYVYRIPGRLRLPHERADKHLLRLAFASELRSSLLRQGKRGFTLPIRRWMVGPLRPLCEDALAELKRESFIRPLGVDAVWRTFLHDPESPIWSRAFVLVVLGHYLRRMRSGRSLSCAA